LRCTLMRSRYDDRRTYEWNYEHAPDPVVVEVPAVPGPWDYCGLPVASPLGIAAGPLLNGRWLLYYASLGFDVLTYKTARSAGRAVESGADCVEANFSCPNVASCDGQLYQQPDLAATVAGRLRQAVRLAPLLIKIGHVTDESLAAELIAALEPHAQALVI